MQTADQGYFNADLDVLFLLRADQKQDFSVKVCTLLA